MDGGQLVIFDHLVVKCGHIYTFDANLRYPTDNMMSIQELSKRYESYRMIIPYDTINVREFRDLSFPDRRIDNEELSNLAKIWYCFIFSSVSAWDFTLDTLDMNLRNPFDNMICTK